MPKKAQSDKPYEGQESFDFVSIDPVFAQRLQELQEQLALEMPSVQSKRHYNKKSKEENLYQLSMDDLDIFYLESPEEYEVNPRDKITPDELDVIDDIVLGFDFNDVDAALETSGWGRRFKAAFYAANASNEYIDAFNYTVQMMAIDVDPSNIFVFTYPVHPDVLIEAIKREPYLLKMAPNYKKTFKQIYECVPDMVLAEALAKDGMLLRDIPGSRLKTAKNNILCVTAVKQNIDAFVHVPVGQAYFDGESNTDVGRIDKKHACMDEQVIDAFLSHSADDPSLYRALEEEWITPNVVKSALVYNFESIRTFGTDWEGPFFSTKRMSPESPEIQPDTATVRVSRDLITEINPEIYDIILAQIEKDPSKFSCIPKNLVSPRLAGDAACMGSHIAKIAFRGFPFEMQLQYFQEKRDAGLLRGRDYRILDLSQVSSLEVDQMFASEQVLFLKYPALSKDLCEFRDINKLNETLEMCYSRHDKMRGQKGVASTAKGFGRHEYTYGKRSLVDGEHSPLAAEYSTTWGFAHSEIREANTKLLENDYKVLLSDIKGLNDIVTFKEYVDTYINSVNFIPDTMNSVYQAINSFDWSYVPAGDTARAVMYENEKYDIACECVAKSGSMIGLVYDSMYPNGIPSKTMENYINAIAVKSDASCYSMIPNPEIEVTRYACAKHPENAAFTTPDVIGADTWNNCIVKSCENNPLFFVGVLFSEYVTDELIKDIIKARPETSVYMTDEQFAPTVLGVDKWNEVALSDVKNNPNFVEALDSNSGCTAEFIRKVAEEVPDCVAYMTDRQKSMLNNPSALNGGEDDGSHGGNRFAEAIKEVSSNEER